MPSEDGTPCLSLVTVQRTNSFRAQLGDLLGHSDNILILGVGNITRGDDGVGSLLVQNIAGRVEACCIDAGIAPENFLEKIVRKDPDTVLIVDAADFGGNPGEIRILEPDQLASGGLSTHALSLQMVCTYLKLRLPVEIHLLAIQPGQTNSEDLSGPVRASLDLLTDLFLEFLPKASRKLAPPAPEKKVPKGD